MTLALVDHCPHCYLANSSAGIRKVADFTLVTCAATEPCRGCIREAQGRGMSDLGVTGILVTNFFPGLGSY